MNSTHILGLLTSLDVWPLSREQCVAELLNFAEEHPQTAVSTLLSEGVCPIEQLVDLEDAVNQDAYRTTSLLDQLQIADRLINRLWTLTHIPTIAAAARLSVTVSQFRRLARSLRINLHPRRGHWDIDGLDKFVVHEEVLAARNRLCEQESPRTPHGLLRRSKTVTGKEILRAALLEFPGAFAVWLDWVTSQGAFPEMDRPALEQHAVAAGVLRLS